MDNSRELGDSDEESTEYEQHERFAYDPYASFESARRPNVEVQSKTLSDLRPLIQAEISCWPELDKETSLGVVESCLDILREADGGSLIIVAPTEQLRSLRTQSADKGYMTRRLKGMPLSSPEFRSVLLDFASHSPELEHDDRWPNTYWDEAARGLPKDGGILLHPNGFVAKGAVKILGLPLAPVQWAGHGTRHEAALGIAAHLKHAVVMIKSSSRLIRCIFALQEGRIAHELSFESVKLPAPDVRLECFTQSSVRPLRHFVFEIEDAAHTTTDGGAAGFKCRVCALLSVFLIIAVVCMATLHKRVTTTTVFKPANKTQLRRAIMDKKGYEDIGAWDTSLITDMSHLFENEDVFNDDISHWNTAQVKTMSGMFYMARRFNKSLSAWNVTRVIDMSQMFYRAESFNSDLNAWDVSKVTNMGHMFQTAVRFNGVLSAWNVAQVIDMSAMLAGGFNEKYEPTKMSFNGDLSAWNVSKVICMEYLFSGATTFNSNLSAWDVAKVKSMRGMHSRAESFNGDLSSWNLGRITDMQSMFAGAESFNGDLSAWNVSRVTTMSGMFWGAKAFNADLGAWNVVSVATMYGMFREAKSFNRDLSAWNVAKVTGLEYMFAGASEFNGDLSAWDVSKVTRMNFMFYNTSTFNGNLSAWNVGAVTDMRSMFYKAERFNGDLSTWNVAKLSLQATVEPPQRKSKWLQEG